METSHIAAERYYSLSRRRFLRGLGVCIALPTFESVRSLCAAPSDDKLAATAAGAPLRSLFVAFPNGTVPAAWWPKEEGKDFEFSPTLKPVEELRQHLQILGGLEHKAANGGPDGSGDHAR